MNAKFEHFQNYSCNFLEKKVIIKIDLKLSWCRVDLDFNLPDVKDLKETKINYLILTVDLENQVQKYIPYEL